MKMPKPKLFFVVNVDWFFLSHRLVVALAAQQNGYDVTVVVGNSGRIHEIADAGLHYIEMPVSRSGTNVLKELFALCFLIWLYIKEKPNIVHHVTPKIVAYGSVAARLTRTKAINAISGLGTVFSEDSAHGLFRKIVLLLFRFGLKDRKQKVIFQNTDDKQLFIDRKIIQSQQAILIIGSGVDLKKFCFLPKLTQKKIIITLPARMLYDKGVVEFVEMARLLKQQDFQMTIKYWLVGGTDQASAKGISQSQLESWNNEGIVFWHGYQEDMVNILGQTDIVVFPSYREGLPKSLIEACAVGRPIVCFDVVGCREVVQQNKNGYLVPFKDIEALVSKVKALIDNELLRMEMGKESRKIAEQKFSIMKVVQLHIELYKNMLSND